MAELMETEYLGKRPFVYVHGEVWPDERDSANIWRESRSRHLWMRTFRELRAGPDPERVRYQLMLRRIGQERQAFDSILPELLRKGTLVGEYVAVVSGSVVDHDLDDQRLAARMLERLGEQPMFIGFVGPQLKIAQVPTPL